MSLWIQLSPTLTCTLSPTATPPAPPPVTDGVPLAPWDSSRDHAPDAADCCSACNGRSGVGGGTDTPFGLSLAARDSDWDGPPIRAAPRTDIPRLSTSVFLAVGVNGETVDEGFGGNIPGRAGGIRLEGAGAGELSSSWSLKGFPAPPLLLSSSSKGLAVAVHGAAPSSPNGLLMAEAEADLSASVEFPVALGAAARALVAVAAGREGAEAAGAMDGCCSSKTLLKADDFFGRLVARSWVLDNREGGAGDGDGATLTLASSDQANDLALGAEVLPTDVVTVAVGALTAAAAAAAAGGGMVMEFDDFVRSGGKMTGVGGVVSGAVAEADKGMGSPVGMDVRGAAVALVSTSSDQAKARRLDAVPESLVEGEAGGGGRGMAMDVDGVLVETVGTSEARQSFEEVAAGVTSVFAGGGGEGANTAFEKH